MTIRACFFDFGGVIQRTEFQAPRQHLGERFGLDYQEIDRLVFETDSAKRATLGEIQEEEHWVHVVKQLNRPENEIPIIKGEFFGGDVIDRGLVEAIRRLRRDVHTGLISNAWSGMRAHLTDQNLLDLFDSIVISAEVGVMKPGQKIFSIAVEQAGVQAGEAVFIDDVAVNIEACQKAGMKGILFRDPDQAIQDLNHLLMTQGSTPRL